MGDVDDYLGTLQGEERAILTAIRERVQELVPDADQGRSYGMAALLHRGKPLLAAIATDDHLSIFPFSSGVVSLVADDLEGYALSKGTIRFGIDQPLPEGVVDRVILARRDEIDAALD